MIDTLSQQLEITPLTAPLAGVKSATRIDGILSDPSGSTNKKRGAAESWVKIGVQPLESGGETVTRLAGRPFL